MGIDPSHIDYKHINTLPFTFTLWWLSFTFYFYHFNSLNFVLIFWNSTKKFDKEPCLLSFLVHFPCFHLHEFQRKELSLKLILIFAEGQRISWQEQESIVALVLCNTLPWPLHHDGYCNLLSGNAWVLQSLIKVTIIKCHMQFFITFPMT